VHGYDFAIFVFQPDDISQIRDVMVRTIRDKVVFELSMFIAVLGKERGFFLVPKDLRTFTYPQTL
jgi:predicted nucleotide-binding protein